MITDPLEFKELTGRSPIRKPTESEKIMESIGNLYKALLSVKPPNITVTLPQQAPPRVEVNIPPAIEREEKEEDDDRAWVFTVERDADGRLARIIAKPL